jgi:hypothetical protein
MRQRPSILLRDAPTSRRIARSLSCALLASALAAGASALPTYESVPLGFIDAEHTRSDGFQSGNATRLTESGRVVGYSARFNGGTPGLGSSSWVYDPTDQSLTRLGFLDASHTQDGGYQQSFTNDVSESGIVVGGSMRYGGAAWLGRSAWIYDPSDDSTTRLGFIDGAHTRSDGFQTSDTSFLTESGYAAGSSQRYNGSSLHGLSSWVYDTSDDSFTRIGFFDAAHTRSDGMQDTAIIDFTESGYAAGISDRFDGSATLGLSAWFYDANDGSTTRIGFFDAMHTSSSNQQLSNVSRLTGSGYAAGTSWRFSGATVLGQSAWLYDANDGSTTRLGFFDATHTRTDGSQTSTPNHLTESGYAAGTSQRYDGSTPMGTSVWIYDRSDGSTTRAGLLDADHTGSSGQQYSNVDFLTDTGYAVGSSERYTGVISGQSVWLYDLGDDSSTRVGLFDALHTRSDGFQYSLPSFLTESGYVAGLSDRYGDAGDLGRSAWIYDASDGSLDTIILAERSNGFAWTSLSFLGEDGLALGAYQFFDTDDNYLGYRAFAWTPDDGAVDLGALVAGGLTAEGWDRLASAVRANGLGMIIGQGNLLSGGEIGYLLVPVPEPGTGLLVTAGLLGLAMRRKRHTRNH